MSGKSRLVFFSLLIIASFILSSCTTPTPQTIIQTVEVQVPGEQVVVTQIVTVEAPTPQPVEATTGKVLRMSAGQSDIPSIDPSHASWSIEIQVIGTTSIGLVRQNETTGEIENGMATSYDVSADGLVYTFHLMSNVPWVKWDANAGQVVTAKDCEGNDRMVTADDFKYGILRTLNPAIASEYAYVLTPYLKGANDYNTGVVTDTLGVGVNVIDPQTIEYTFDNPGVYNLNLLGLWVAHAQPSWLIEGDDCTDARGDRWIEAGFYEGYGPYTLKEWYHDYYMTLVKNPFWPGTDSVPSAKIDEIQLKFLDLSTEFAEFEAGNLDISSIPSGDQDRVMADPTYAAMIEQVYTLGTEFYAFNTKLAPTDDVRVRKALSMSIDREAIVLNVSKSGIVAPFFTNPGAAGAPKPETYPDLGIKYDPVAAKALIDEYAAEKGITPDQVKISLLFNTTESNKLTAEAIQAMWQEALGITVDISSQESKVYRVSRVEGKENVYRSSWVQDYPDANNFLMEVFGPDTGYQKVVDWVAGDAGYDQFLALITQAQTETDPAKRMDLYAQAEKIFVQDEAIVAPIYWYATPVLIQPYVIDLPSITGYDHWEKWDINK